MTDNPSAVVAGDPAGRPVSLAPESPVETPQQAAKARRSIFDRRSVPPLSLEERAVRTDAIERSLQFGAEPVRDGRGWALEVDFIEANREAVEPWKHDRRDKRFYRRSQQVAKAAGQLIGQPGDRIELATRFARLHRREGSDVEGAVRRGLFDAIWRFDHVYDSYTVPRRYGTHIMKTGRVAAVAEEARRRWQAEGLAPADAFWVRNRRNTGLVLVSPNADPDAPPPEVFQSGEGVETVVGQADLEQAFDPFLPNDDFDIPTESYDPSGFYRFVEGDDGRALFVFDPQADDADARRQVDTHSLDDLAEGFIAALDVGRGPDDPQWKQSARFLAEFLPVTGHVISAREAYLAFRAASTAMQNGDWEEALLKGGESLLNAAGAVPALGDLLRFGKGAVKLANLLLQMGHRTDIKPQVLAMAGAGGSGSGRGGRGAGGVPGGGLGSGSSGRDNPGSEGRGGTGAGKVQQGPKERFTLPPEERGINWNRDLKIPKRSRHPETGTTLYSVPGQPVADWVIRRGRPLGFKTNEAFKDFVDELHGTTAALDPQVRLGIRGSAINGVSYDKRRESFSSIFFDTKKKAADFDLAIVSSKLVRFVRGKGVRVIRSQGGLRSKPIKDRREFDRLGLSELFDVLTEQADGREISFMFYESVEQLERRGNMMLLK